MKGLFTIYVEGIADVVFFKQYIHHLWGVEVSENSIVKLDGWTNLKGAAWQQRMKTMTDNGGTNIVIIDADKDIDARRSDILKWKQDNSLEFELFCFPTTKMQVPWKTCWRTSSTRTTSRFLIVGKDTKRNW